MKKLLILVIGFLLFCSTAHGITQTFDFNSGLDPQFTVTGDDGGLFTLDTSSQKLRLFKTADDGSVNSATAISKGITSTFSIDGDFTITTDFTLDDFPFPPIDLTELRFNQSYINISSVGGRDFMVRRLRIREFDKMGVFANPEGPLGNTISSLMAGRYLLSRSGSTVTGYYAPSGSSTFTNIASVTNFIGSVKINLGAVQGRSITATSRSTTSLDISFDNLVIAADSVNVVPEPSTMLLLGTGLIGIAVIAIRNSFKRLNN